MNTAYERDESERAFSARGEVGSGKIGSNVLDYGMVLNILLPFL